MCSVAFQKSINLKSVAAIFYLQLAQFSITNKSALFPHIIINCVISIIIKGNQSFVLVENACCFCCV